MSDEERAREIASRISGQFMMMRVKGDMVALDYMEDSIEEAFLSALKAKEREVLEREEVINLNEALKLMTQWVLTSRKMLVELSFENDLSNQDMADRITKSLEFTKEVLAAFTRMKERL